MGPDGKEDQEKRCLDNSREDCEVLGLSVSVAEKLINDRLVFTNLIQYLGGQCVMNALSSSEH